MPESWQSAWVEVLPDFSEFRRKANTEMSTVLGAAGTAGGVTAGQNMNGGILAAVPKLAGPLVAVFAALGLGNLIGETIGNGIVYGLDSVDLASDLNESFNAVKVTFGEEIAADLKLLAAQAPKSLKLTQKSFNELATRFSSFAKTVVGDGGDVVGFMDDLTTRGADFASVYNLEVSDALTLFQSGLAGESEPLRKFGLDLSAASVEAFAYANGITTAGDALTEAEKVQARYGLLLQQTAAVEGDAANTSGELAAQRRELAVALEEAQTKFGEALLPTALDITQFANDELLPILTAALAEAGPELAKSIEDELPAIKELIASLAENLPEAIDAGIGLAGLIADSIEGDLQLLEDGQKTFEMVDGFFNTYLPRWAAGTVPVEESWSGFFNWWDIAWDGTADTVENKSDEIKDYWSSSLDAMLADAEAASLESAGVALAQGFADGIETGTEAALRAVEDMALRTVEKAQNSLRIASPSKVFEEIGGYVAQGMALGIDNGSDLVATAVSSLVTIPKVSTPQTIGFASTTTTAESNVRDVYFQGTDPAVVYAQFKQEIGGRLAIA